MTPLYVYFWKNNPKRFTMHNRLCKILVSGKMNSIMIQFIDNGQREITSRRSLRKSGYTEEQIEPVAKAAGLNRVRFLNLIQGIFPS